MQHVTRLFQRTARLLKKTSGLSHALYTSTRNMDSSLRSLDNLQFDNSCLKHLPVDPVTENHVRRVQGACFSLVTPTPVKNPTLVAHSPEALKLLPLDPEETKKPEFAEYFTGNKILNGSLPAAHCYCGHQFGYFSGQLGDGRAIYLGEIINANNERWELQLKGAGKTPYSRTADGRAVLRSSVREFLCSEAFYYLGIPTTRAGTLITSDTKVMRDPMYDGNEVIETAAIVSRIARTFLRFGSFEIVRFRDAATGREGSSPGRKDITLILLEFVIKNYYPQFQHLPTINERCEAFFRELTLRTARMIAAWQCFGWVHGVMNTDNMSIIGDTIDYGPFGFLDAFNPNFTANGSDEEGRYAYKNQPKIGRWNLEKLAEVLAFWLDETKAAEILQEYDREFKTSYLNTMRNKLGLINATDESRQQDLNLVEELFQIMEKTGLDFTNTFRGFNKTNIADLKEFSSEIELAPSMQIFSAYLMTQTLAASIFSKMHEPEIAPAQLQKLMMIAETNPDFLSLMGKTPEWVRSQAEKLEKYQELKMMTPEMKANSDKQVIDAWLLKYQQRLRQLLNNRAADDAIQLQEQRVAVMNATNPKYILRNYLIQGAITKASVKDYSELKNLQEMIKTPFSETLSGELVNKNYDQKAPEWAYNLCMTCSS